MKPILTFGATARARLGWAMSITALCVAGGAVSAQDAEGILLELNGAATTPEGACQLTMVVTNQMPQGLKRAAWQIAIFDDQGAVKSLPVLDFGALLPGKTRVAQFALPDQDCAKLGRIVVNDVAECTADDGTDRRDACLRGLTTQDRSQIGFGL